MTMVSVPALRGLSKVLESPYFEGEIGEILGESREKIEDFLKTDL